MRDPIINLHGILTAISPVHIGTGDQITPLDYFLLSTPAKKYVVYNTHRYVKQTAEPVRKAEELKKLIEEKKNRCSLGDFIDEPSKYCEEYWHYCASLDEFTYNKLQATIVSSGRADVYELLKETSAHHGQTPIIYIPGTSLKGSLRTALMYALVSRNHTLGDSVQAKALPLQGIGASGNQLEDLIFRNEQDEAYYDTWKTIFIDDAPAALEGTKGLRVYYIRTLKQLRNKRVQWQYNTFYECIAPMTEFHVCLSLASSLLSREDYLRHALQWNRGMLSLTLEQFIGCINQFAADLVRYELDYLDEFSSDREQLLEIYHFYDLLAHQIATELATVPARVCYLCIGKGTGWHKKTIGAYLKAQMPRRDSDDFRFRRGLGSVYHLTRKGKHKLEVEYVRGKDGRFYYRCKRCRSRVDFRDVQIEQPFPKTRIMTMQADEVPFQPLGWMKLDFQEPPGDFLFKIPMIE